MAKRPTKWTYEALAARIAWSFLLVFKQIITLEAL
jgi:hypothetical protein